MNTFPIEKAFQALVEPTYPDFHLFYPRRTITPAGYLNTRYVSAMMCHNYYNPDSSYPSVQTMNHMADSLIDTKMQTFWVGQKICEDLLRTTPPKDVSFLDIPWPFSSFIIMVPYGFLCELNTHVSHIMVYVDKTKNTLHGVFCVIIDAGFKMGSFSIPLTNNIPDVDTEFITTTVQEKQPVSIKVIMLLANIVCYMSSEGAVVDNPQRMGKPNVSKGRHTDDGLWTPRWVAQHHHRDAQNHGGTHASPRTHWRRGHFRNQRIGEGRNNCKRLWIKPTLINTESGIT